MPHGTGGSGGGSAGSGGFGQLCPESFAAYYCFQDTVCKYYPSATDCSKHECGAPCQFGCLDGNCLPDPDAQVGGAAGMGGGG